MSEVPLCSMAAGEASGRAATPWGAVVPLPSECGTYKTFMAYIRKSWHIYKTVMAYISQSRHG
jgi:hypothetical protein